MVDVFAIVGGGIAWRGLGFIRAVALKPLYTPPCSQNSAQHKKTT